MAENNDIDDMCHPLAPMMPEPDEVRHPSDWATARDRSAYGAASILNHWGEDTMITAQQFHNAIQTIHVLEIR